MRPDLVAKEMRRWELDKRVRARFQQDERTEERPLTVITFSRQWGSGGTNIARLVAKELEFKLFDRELIDYVAELSGADPDQIATQDEVHQGLFGNIILQVLEGKRPTESAYLRALVRVVRRISREGNAVVIGRGSTLILPQSYRVRIIAPEPIRVARIADLHGLDEASARRAVTESDRQRSYFIRAYFGADAKDAMNYDQVVNTERCGIEHAAALIIRGFCSRREELVDACQSLACSSEMLKS